MPGRTSARGYGTRHQTLRKLWAISVASGTVRCARCGLHIVPGAAWDLGHDDHDRSRYRGPEHTGCNRGHRAAGPPLVEIKQRWSREW
jgi:hypothetical protein